MESKVKMYKISIFVLVSAMTICVQAQSQKFSEEWKANVKARVAKGFMSSIVVGVITKGGVEYFSYGVKSIKSKEPVDEHTVYEIGSNTKTFTGLLLAQEVLAGRLSLDTPVQNLVPEGIKVPSRNGKTINLVHLASHTSALPRLPDNFPRENPLNPFATITTKTLLDFISTYKLTYDIGTKCVYSNLGSGLLGNLIAMKQNTTYDKLVLKRIIEPLGMNDTRIFNTPEMQKRLAAAYSAGKEVEPWTSEGFAPAGMLKSTANDMLKYLSANMGITKCKLYPAMQLAQKSTGFGIPNRFEFGLLWILMKAGDKEIIWHDGATGGYMSFMGFTADRKKGVVVLTSGTSFPDDIGLNLLSSKSKLTEIKDLKMTD